MSAIKEKNSPATVTPDREIVMSRLFDAPREVVWDAFTDPKQVVEWWGPTGFTTTIHEMDVRPGGRWRHTMHGPDGTNYPNASVFKEVVKPERIVYGHGGGKEGGQGVSFEATWTFEAQGDKTLLTGRMVFPTAAAREFVVKEHGAIEGGKQTLARLDQHLEKAPIVVERTFSATAETVWKAITEVDQMKQWYMPALGSFEPRVGFETEFSIHHEGKDFPHIWKVTEVVPEKKIAYDWKYRGYPGSSVVTFELFPEGENTRLRLTHTGLETFIPKSNPDLARKNFLQGWTQLGTELQQFLEKTKVAELPDPNTTLFLSRDFKAERECVFGAFLDATVLQNIWSAPAYKIVEMAVDARVGGGWKLAMRDEATGSVNHCTARYVEIERPVRIVWLTKWLDGPLAGAPEGRVTLEFGAIAGGTRLKLTHEFFPDRETRDHHGTGWASGLERLTRWLAGELSQ